MDTDEIFFSDNKIVNNPLQSNFSDRQKNLFDHLLRAENNNKNRITPTDTPMAVDLPPPRESNKRKRHETRHFQGKESIFKRPEEPMSKCLPPKHIPDFKKNPHKWTKYSLGDVRSEDTSERGNTAAALSFLREMEQRKSAGVVNCDSFTDVKPEFKKSVLVHHEESGESEEKATFKGSKIVMPEYVVGEKKRSTKKHFGNKITSQQKIKEVKLDHLLQEEELCDD